MQSYQVTFRSMKALDTEWVDMTLLEEMTEAQMEDYLKCKYGEDAPTLIEAIKDKLNNTLHE